MLSECLKNYTTTGMPMDQRNYAEQQKPRIKVDSAINFTINFMTSNLYGMNK